MVLWWGAGTPSSLFPSLLEVHFQITQDNTAIASSSSLCPVVQVTFSPHRIFQRYPLCIFVHTGRLETMWLSIIPVGCVAVSPSEVTSVWKAIFVYTKNQTDYSPLELFSYFYKMFRLLLLCVLTVCFGLVSFITCRRVSSPEVFMSWPLHELVVAREWDGPAW